jgi:hypothetical protein
VKELRAQSDALKVKVESWRMSREELEAEVGSLFA